DNGARLCWGSDVGREAGKWRKWVLRGWRETLCYAQCFEHGTGRDGLLFGTFT
nr:hypothetical protein [Tanacetum cinerariifolium]